jgi:hypothetical protein
MPQVAVRAACGLLFGGIVVVWRGRAPGLVGDVKMHDPFEVITGHAARHRLE